MSGRINMTVMQYVAPTNSADEFAEFAKADADIIGEEWKPVPL